MYNSATVFCKQIDRDNSGSEHHKKLVKAERDDDIIVRNKKERVT